MHLVLDVNNSSTPNFLYLKNNTVNWKNQVDGSCYGAHFVR